MFRIESRYPTWARWRIVTASPHRETRPFDKTGLIFTDHAEAESAMESMKNANAGEFRIIEA